MQPAQAAAVGGKHGATVGLFVEDVAAHTRAPALRHDGGHLARLGHDVGDAAHHRQVVLPHVGIHVTVPGGAEGCRGLVVPRGQVDRDVQRPLDSGELAGAVEQVRALPPVRRAHRQGAPAAAGAREQAVGGEQATQRVAGQRPLGRVHAHLGLDEGHQFVVHEGCEGLGAARRRCGRAEHLAVGRVPFGPGHRREVAVAGHHGRDGVVQRVADGHHHRRRHLAHAQVAGHRRHRTRAQAAVGDDDAVPALLGLGRHRRGDVDQERVLDGVALHRPEFGASDAVAGFALQDLHGWAPCGGAGASADSVNSLIAPAACSAATVMRPACSTNGTPPSRSACRQAPRSCTR